MVFPSASRKSLLKISAITLKVSLPVTLIKAIAPFPEGVDKAQIVLLKFIGFNFSEGLKIFLNYTKFKAMIRKFTLLIGILILNLPSYSQNSCSNPDIIVSGQFDVFTLPTGAGTAPGGPNYGCLTNTLNPYYYVLTVCTPGDIIIDMQSAGSGADINYVCWGPIVGATSTADLCNSVITGAPVASCSESINIDETMTITNAQPGEAYLVMMTNINDIPDQVYVWENFATVGTYCDSTANMGCSGAMLNLCEVTMNDSVTHCKVMWEKIPGLAVDYYNIYRMNTSGIYDLIDIVFDSDSSYYIDISSNPNVMAYRYKIDYMDTCGNVSWQSDYHQSIHLQASPGFNSVNLNWNDYYGLMFNTYYIMRGTDPFNMYVLDSISNVFTAYTDVNPDPNEPCYQVNVVNPNPCDVTRTAGQYAKSNVFFQFPVGVEEISATDFKVYPNPANDILTIENNSSLQTVNIEMMDAGGRLIRSESFTGKSHTIQLIDFAPGFYSIRMNLSGSIINKSIVIVK